MKPKQERLDRLQQVARRSNKAQNQNLNPPQAISAHPLQSQKVVFSKITIFCCEDFWMCGTSCEPIGLYRINSRGFDFLLLKRSADHVAKKGMAESPSSHLSLDLVRTSKSQQKKRNPICYVYDHLELCSVLDLPWQLVGLA